MSEPKLEKMSEEVINGIALAISIIETLRRRRLREEHMAILAGSFQILFVVAASLYAVLKLLRWLNRRDPDEQGGGGGGDDDDPDHGNDDDNDDAHDHGNDDDDDAAPPPLHRRRGHWSRNQMRDRWKFA
mmetsp:Transcript_11193/g.46701  ORF Transcript_11193/g.46701 Transcript_11193/m.46701 type:complete len:130 (-) Transcript_11193:520-909(-)